MMPSPRPRKRRDKAPTTKLGSAKSASLRAGDRSVSEAEETSVAPGSGSASRRRPTRVPATTILSNVSGGFSPSATVVASGAAGRADAVNAASPLAKRSRSTNPNFARGLRRQKRETDCAVGLVLERITPDDETAGRRRPRSSKVGSAPPSSESTAARAADKLRVKKESCLPAKRGSASGNGNGSVASGTQGAVVRTDSGGGNGPLSIGNAGGNGGNGSSAGTTASAGRRSGGRRSEAATKSVVEKPRSPLAATPRALSPRATSPRGTSRAPSPTRNASPAKRTRMKIGRRGSKSSSRSRLRRKRVNYTYQLLNELSLSPRRPTTKGRAMRPISAQRAPWRAAFLKSCSKASVAKLSRLGSRSSLGSGARRRCRSSRPTRYRVQAERRRADSRPRSPARILSRSPSTASVCQRARRHRDRPATRCHKQTKRCATRKGKSRMGRHRSRKSRSRGSIGSSVSSRYSRISKSKRAAAKARAKVRRRSGQGRRRRPRDPTFALENILEFLEPPKGDNKVIAKQPPPVVVRPSPPPTPRVSTGRLTPSADFMHPDTATVIHDVLQELQGPKSNQAMHIPQKPCVSAADIREKLASTSCVLGEDAINSKSRGSATDVLKSKSVCSTGRRSAETLSQDRTECNNPVSSNLLLDTLRQMCNTPSRFVMHHRRRVPRSEREWAMGAAQKVGNMGPWPSNTPTTQGPTLAQRITMSRSLIPQAWLGPKFPSKSHLKSTRSNSARSSNFSNACASAAAIAAASVAASAPNTPGAAYGGGPVAVTAVKSTSAGAKEGSMGPMVTYKAPLAPPGPGSTRSVQSALRSTSSPNPFHSTRSNNSSAPRIASHQLGSSGVRPLMRALSAHTCSPLRRVPSNSEIRRPPTDIVSALNLSPSSSSTSSRYRRRRRRRITGARQAPRDPVSAVQLFAQPPHPLWPPMAAVRRKGSPKHPLSQSSLATSTATTVTAITVNTNPVSNTTEQTGEARPLRSCLKSAIRRPHSPLQVVKTDTSDSQFGGVGEGSVVPPENPFVRFNK